MLTGCTSRAARKAQGMLYFLARSEPMETARERNKIRELVYSVPGEREPAP